MKLIQLNANSRLVVNILVQSNLRNRQFRFFKLTGDQTF